MAVSTIPSTNVDSEVGALFAPQSAQLGGADALVSEISVDAARLPVAGIAGIDDDDPVEIAREPERGAQSGGPTADN